MSETARRWPGAALFSTRRLQVRIVVVFLGMLLAVQGVSVMLIGQRIDHDARNAVDAELQSGQRLFERLLQQESASLNDAARLLAQDYGFRSAVASQDGDTLASALQNQAERIGASIAVFTDAKFHIKASTQSGAEYVVPALRRQAASPERTARITMLQGQAYLLATVPVKAPNTIGWVGMLFRIEAPLLAQMEQLSSIKVVLLARETSAGALPGSAPGWRAMQSTLHAEANTAFLAAWEAAQDGPDIARSLNFELPSQPVSGDPVADGPTAERMVARAMPIGVSGEPPMVAVLMRSMEEARAPYRRLQWLIGAFTAVAVAVFGIGAVLLGRHVTMPLRALTRSARKLGRGDYGGAVAVGSQDEIGELAQAFETMRQAVQEREREVRRLAYEDTLTGLPNRVQFRADLRRAIAESRLRQEPCAVLLLDLDRFKLVNDVLGNRFGDRVLQQVAGRLQEHRGSEADVVARLGGDQFALLLHGLDAAAGAAVARRIVQRFEAPISLDDHTVDISAGIGVASCPEHGAQIEDELIGRAELAMHSAKQAQLGVAIYTPQLDSSSEESLSLLTELRAAIDQNQLRLYLQPKIDLASGRVVGAEALLRWQHPTRGMVSPLQFIPFAERTGFIRMLTGWVLERCACLLEQLQHGGHPLKLSVNISTRDLIDQDLPGKLQRLLDAHALQASGLGLCLEITESAIMDDPQRALQTLERLHSMGLQLSIDDFGTGYSSLAYLKRLPVDELKIDQSFVLNMERDLDDAKIVKSTIDLAHNLGLRVVAEGVETAKAWKLLQSLGCDQAQGYFIARPMPEALFINWVREWSAPGIDAVKLDTDFSVLANA